LLPKEIMEKIERARQLYLEYERLEEEILKHLEKNILQKHDVDMLDYDSGELWHLFERDIVELERKFKSKPLMVIPVSYGEVFVLEDGRVVFRKRVWADNTLQLKFEVLE